MHFKTKTSAALLDIKIDREILDSVTVALKECLFLSYQNMQNIILLFSIAELIDNAAASARSWIGRAKEAARHDQRRLEKFVNVEGMIPSLRDPERFSFWLATLSNRRPSERLELLRIRDTKEQGVDINAIDRILLQSSKPFLHTNVDCNALFAAVVSRQINVVKLLLQKAVLDIIRARKVVKSSNASRFSSLLFVTHANDIEALKKVVENRNINLDEQNESGFSAVMISASEGSVEAFKLLLHAGADVTNLKNKDGLTALDIIDLKQNGEDGHKVMFEYALKKGCLKKI
ncbi:unnamed protein product [Vicia faba]|uniref:Uncharacterized protein n=1 Tax=Vicia faba TaxID=3906 RepID=A0AAV0ZIS2_VICFA|nr:unnamed protein product [Vicia faba]